MAKKSNKTAHVLNLLTNNRETAEDHETIPVFEPPVPAVPPAEKPPDPPKPKSAVHLSDSLENALSEQIRAQLEQLYVEETTSATAGQPLAARKETAGVYTEDEHSEKQSSAPSAMPEESARQESSAPAQPITDIPELVPGIDNGPVDTESLQAAPEPAPQNPGDLLLQVKKMVQDKQAEISTKETSADMAKHSTKSFPVPDPVSITKKNNESGVTMSENLPNNNASNDYVTINVVEDIVKTKAHDYAIKLGGCGCYRCVSDIIALTLNSLKPQYIVTHKGMLFAKITSYENQYAADISSALTKACMMVRDAPRH